MPVPNDGGSRTQNELISLIRTLPDLENGSWSALSAACNSLSISKFDEKEQHWKIFVRSIEFFLNTQKDCAPESISAIRRFLTETKFRQVAHLVRRDRNVWNLCLHIVREDGVWLVCDTLYNGAQLLIGRSKTGPDHVIGRHGEAEPSREAVRKDQADGLYEKAQGVDPPAMLIFSNGRPVDQSVSVAKFSAFFNVLSISEHIRIYQNQDTAYFRPDIFPALASAGAISYYDPRSWAPRKDALQKGVSMIEATYLPDNGWDVQALLLRQVAERLNAGLPKRAALPAPAMNLRLFCSLEFEKRFWVEQEVAFVLLFDKLRGLTKKLTVILNGMTGSIFPDSTERLEKHYQEIFVRERQICEKWKSKFGDFLEIRFLGGMDLQRKVEASRHAHFFIAPAGTAALIALMAETPGLFYSHPSLQMHFRNQLKGFPQGRMICRNSTTAVVGDGGVMTYSWAGSDGQSYSIPVDEFLSEVWPDLKRLVS